MKSVPAKPFELRRELLSLSHELGQEDRGLAILGEGNTSARISGATFWVKASGFNLATLSAAGLTECRIDKLLGLLDASDMDDAEIDRALLASRVSDSARKPSVEAMFHAYLLTLPGVRFVGHTHPVSVNGILCSDSAANLAHRRLFPDDIVCCGKDSVLVPYADPGLKLGQAIRRETMRYMKRRGVVPRVILIENHGLIALGSTPHAVLAATLMTEKAARVLSIASSGGRKPRFLTERQVDRIGGRPDEHHRRRILGI
jgi:rhamnose utilization protein RhaD (predicted bifunctional aldolase and dehydrogenase)